MKILYKHLNEQCQDVVLLDAKDRIRYMYKDILIEYPKIKEIHSLLNQLMDRPKKPRMQNLLIIGESNIGKTSIISSFEKKHKSYGIEDENKMNSSYGFFKDELTKDIVTNTNANTDSSFGFFNDEKAQANTENENFGFFDDVSNITPNATIKTPQPTTQAPTPKPTTKKSKPIQEKVTSKKRFIN